MILSNYSFHSSDLELPFLSSLFFRILESMSLGIMEPEGKFLGYNCIITAE